MTSEQLPEEAVGTAEDPSPDDRPAPLYLIIVGGSWQEINRFRQKLQLPPEQAKTAQWKSLSLTIPAPLDRLRGLASVSKGGNRDIQHVFLDGCFVPEHRATLRRVSEDLDHLVGSWWITETTAIHDYRKPSTPAELDEDGPCSQCGGEGCPACDARHLPPEPLTT